MAGVDILATAFTGANAAFIADLYARWVENPDSVDPSFAELFAALNDDARAVLTDASGASWAPRPRGGFAPEPEAPPARQGRPRAPLRRPPPSTRPASARAQLDSIRALMLIRGYRVRGHLEAQLDPLGLQQPKSHPELDPKTYGFTEADLDRPIFIDNVLGRDTATLARDHGGLPRHLLRADRRRVHAHPGPGPEGLDPAAGSKAPPGRPPSTTAAKQRDPASS